MVVLLIVAIYSAAATAEVFVSFDFYPHSDAAAQQKLADHQERHPGAMFLPVGD